MNKRRATGVINIDHRERHEHSVELIGAIQFIGEQMGRAIGKSLLAEKNMRLAAETEEMKRLLEMRKAVERAKGLLPRRHNLTDPPSQEAWIERPNTTDTFRAPLRPPIIRRHGGSMRRRFSVAAQFAATCLIGCVNIVPGWAGPQTPAAAGASEFEVASVKQFDQSVPPGQSDLSFVGTSGKPFKIAGNRVTITGTLRVLIAAAYGIKDFQISAAPPWAGTAIFSITAKTSGDAAPTQEQVRPMLQSLLADRFQLKAHHETKELPVYHLTQSKKSNLFKPAAAEETFSWNITPGPGGTVRSKATRESIGDFVQLVGVSADRPVIDKTGLTGDIDYEIQFYQQDARTQDDMNRIIVDAVKDQLGFKLEPAKDPVDVLVVDRVEKPSEN